MLPEHKNILACDNCHSTAHKRKRTKVFYAKLTVTNEKGIELPLTFFDDTIRQLIDIYNNINYEGNVVRYNEATEEEITEAILSKLPM